MCQGVWKENSPLDPREEEEEELEEERRQAGVAGEGERVLLPRGRKLAAQRTGEQGKRKKPPGEVWIENGAKRWRKKMPCPAGRGMWRDRA